MIFSSEHRHEGYKQIIDDEQSGERANEITEISQSAKKSSPRRQSFVYLAIALVGTFVGYLAGHAYPLLSSFSGLEALEGREFQSHDGRQLKFCSTQYASDF